MEFLKQVKKPSTKKTHLLNIKIEIKKKFTENNNDYNSDEKLHQDYFASKKTSNCT